MSFFPFICNSQEQEEEVKGKDDNLVFPNFSPLDSINNKKCDSGSDVEKYYCKQGMKLYKPRVSFSLENHKFKWNYRGDVLIYTYRKHDSIEYDLDDDSIIYKHKFLFNL